MNNTESLAGHFIDICVGYSTSDAINALGLAMVGIIHAEALNSANGCALVDDMAKNMKEWLRREKVQ